MSKHTNFVGAAAYFSISMLLVACGGGGGGGGGNVTASSAPVTISASNAEEVAAASYKTTAGLEGSGGATGFLTGAAVTTPNPRIDMIDTLLSQVKTIPQLAASNPAALLTGVVVSETIPCTSGGSMSFTFDDADNDQQMSSGDSMTFSADGCVEEGATMNGSMSMNVLSVSGDPASVMAPYSMQLSMQVNNFTVTEGVETVTLNGGMTMSESTTDGVLFSHSITGSSIQVTEGGVNASLSNFSIGATEDNSTVPQAYTLDLNATVSSSELGGSVTIVTDIVFQGIEPDEPTSGQATITGANNSRVTLIAMGQNMVRLEIDENGDGMAETFIDTTWDAL